MGWLGGHLHAFDTGDTVCRLPSPDGDLGWGRRSNDERTVVISDVLAESKARLRWDYDFGDSRQPDVAVESIHAKEPGFDPGAATAAGPTTVPHSRSSPAVADHPLARSRVRGGNSTATASPLKRHNIT